MAILSFKKRFASKVRTGKKRQTIRAIRKYPIHPNERLYLYTGLRTKYTKKLKEVICLWVYNITIKFNSGVISITNGPKGDDSEFMEFKTEPALNLFARHDGFKDWNDMKAFWISEHGVKKGNRKVILKVFKGILITW